ncbi:MAG: tetratricopeptide repeat protein [Bacteroidales bacterium]|nr:tetratricopeptide repeat protein [Bacteroidales bacterium]
MKRILPILIIAALNTFPSFNQVYDKQAFLLGSASLLNGKYEQAELYFDSALKQMPSDFRLVSGRGMARYYLGKTNLAIDDFKRATALGHAESWFWLAKCFGAMNKPEETILALEKYLEMDKNADPYQLFKDESIKKIHYSIQWQHFIAGFEPTSMQLAIASANKFMAIENFSEAHRQIENVLAVIPLSDLLHYTRAKIYEEEGNLSMARYETLKALDIAPKNYLYLLKLADIDFSMQNYNEAYKYYLQAKTDFPWQFELNLKISNTCLKLDKPIEAGKYAAEYLFFFPGDTAALFLGAQASFLLNDYLNVLRQMNALLKTAKPRAEWFKLRGMAYYQTNTYALAANDLSMGLDLAPLDAEANYYMGLAEIALNNKQRACYFFNRALQLGDVRALDFLGKNCTSRQFIVNPVLE